MKLEFEAHDTQLEVLKSRARYKVLSCGRRWGKDHNAPIEILSHSFGYKSPRGSKLYAYLNPVYTPQSKDSFRVFCELAGSGGLIAHKVESPPMRVDLINGDQVNFFSLDRADNLRGGQYDGIILNEAAMIPNLKEVWDYVVQAMLLDRQGWAVLQSTPKGKNDFFKYFQMGQSDDPRWSDWESFQFSTYTNPFMDPKAIDKIKDQVPEDVFKQEYLAEFLDDGGTVFRGLVRMLERSLAMETRLVAQADSCRIGIDIATHGDFTVLLALSPDYRVIGFDRFNNLDWNIIHQRIVAFCSRYRGRIVMDVAGAGDPIYQSLARQGFSIEPAKFTNERKAGWVQNLAMLIQEGVVSAPPPGAERGDQDTAALWNELEQYTFDLLPSGRVQYGAPKGFHDDAVTALFLAASVPPPSFIIKPGDPLFNMDLNDVRLAGEI